MYRTILIPLEHSATDQTILSHIRGLAKLMGSQLILVHVADGFAARNQKELNLAESEEMRDDQAYLDGCRDALKREGFQAESILACGEPAKEILRIAGERQCDLIAMSTHGHRLIKDIMLGSVADNVRHRTDIPVLLVRAKSV